MRLCSFLQMRIVVVSRFISRTISETENKSIEKKRTKAIFLAIPQTHGRMREVESIR